MGTKCSCFSESPDKIEELVKGQNKITTNVLPEETIKTSDLAKIAENRLSPFQFHTEDDTVDLIYPVKSAEG